MKKSIKEGEELMQVLVSKAWKSVSFKEQLIINPKVTIEKVTGAKMSIPEGSKIIVEDQTDSNIIYLNIPRKVNLEDLELTEEELEAVSGGDFGASFLVFCAVVGAIAALDYIAGEFAAGWNEY